MGCNVQANGGCGRHLMRLGGTATGLAPWATTTLSAEGRSTIEVIATPCRHGPPLSRPIVGDVIGFALRWEGQHHDVALPETGTDVGIDLGLTHFAVLSDGAKVDAPTFLRRSARKLKRLQQNLSRKAKGSQNRKKAVMAVARAHARVADMRRDWLHTLSTKVVRDNQAIYVEDLCVAGLGRTRLARSVHDAGWSQFVGMVEYKAARAGRAFAIELCRAIRPRTVIPVHYEGWRHFRQSRAAAQREFADAADDIRRSVRWLDPGVSTEIVT